MLSLQGGRPLQIESLGAAALTALGLGGPYAVVTSSGSQNLSGSLVGIAGGLSTGLSIVTVLAALALGARGALRAPDDRSAISELARWTLAAVAAGIAFGHVLSPQFVLWLLPFPLLVAGRRGYVLAAMTALACLLTLEEFPGRYWQYAAGLDRGVASLVLVRDLVLVAIVIAAFYTFRRNVSIAVARPVVGSHSTSAPSSRTSPSATSNFCGSCVRKRRSTISERTPITDSCGPVMPASVR